MAPRVKLLEGAIFAEVLASGSWTTSGSAGEAVATGTSNETKDDRSIECATISAAQLDSDRFPKDVKERRKLEG